MRLHIILVSVHQKSVTYTKCQPAITQSVSMYSIMCARVVTSLVTVWGHIVLSEQGRIYKKKCNKVVCAIVHKFAYIKTIECNNVVSSNSIGFCVFILELCKKIRPCCTEQHPQGRNYDTTLFHWCNDIENSRESHKRVGVKHECVKYISHAPAGTPKIRYFETMHIKLWSVVSKSIGLEYYTVGLGYYTSYL